MRFFHDDPRKVRVNWFFVPEGTAVVPYSHVFGSRIYERDEPGETQPEVGEVYYPVPWRGGQPPCPLPSGGLCGSREQWENGASIADPLPPVYPGTNVPTCCLPPLRGACGGLALGGNVRTGVCHMVTTFDSYRPFGGSALLTNEACDLVDDLYRGRGFSPINTVAWTHYMDIDGGLDVLDGCTRTDTLDTLNYADGDEIRIPSGGSSRYVVVWVTLCDTTAGVKKRVYMLRHAV